jgi:hypothetical protein
MTMTAKTVRTPKRRQQFLVGMKIRSCESSAASPRRSWPEDRHPAIRPVPDGDGEYKVSLDTLFHVLGIFG